MKTYAIGDVHGCFDTLEQLLQQIPNKSRLVFIGDIVNRGPKSLETIRTVMRMGVSAREPRAPSFSRLCRSESDVAGRYDF